MLVPLMSRWVTPRSSEYCSPLARPSDQRQGRLLGEPDADLEEVAEVGALDVLHDHEVLPVLLAVIEDLDDVGVMELQPGLGLLVEAIDRAGVDEEALAEDLDGDRLAGGDPHAAIDPREGPLGEVEEDLAAAVEEAGQVALAELVDLPAGHAPLAEQRVRQGVERPVLRGGHRLVGLVLRGQAEQDHLLGQGCGVDFGHDDGLQARSGRGRDRTLSSGRRDRMCGEIPILSAPPPVATGRPPSRAGEAHEGIPEPGRPGAVAAPHSIPVVFRKHGKPALTSLTASAGIVLPGRAPCPEEIIRPALSCMLSFCGLS